MCDSPRSQQPEYSPNAPKKGEVQYWNGYTWVSIQLLTQEELNTQNMSGSEWEMVENKDHNISKNWVVPSHPPDTPHISEDWVELDKSEDSGWKRLK